MARDGYAAEHRPEVAVHLLDGLPPRVDLRGARGGVDTIRSSAPWSRSHPVTQSRQARHRQGRPPAAVISGEPVVPPGQGRPLELEGREDGRLAGVVVVGVHLGEHEHGPSLPRWARSRRGCPRRPRAGCRALRPRCSSCPAPSSAAHTTMRPGPDQVLYVLDCPEVGQDGGPAVLGLEERAGGPGRVGQVRHVTRSGHELAHPVLAGVGGVPAENTPAGGSTHPERHPTMPRSLAAMSSIWARPFAGSASASGHRTTARPASGARASGSGW